MSIAKCCEWFLKHLRLYADLILYKLIATQIFYNKEDGNLETKLIDAKGCAEIRNKFVCIRFC